MRGIGITAAVLVLALARAPVAEGTTPAATVLRTGLPSHLLTPGAFTPAVTQATIHRTICVVGWTATVRPPESHTEPLKVAQIATYGFADKRLARHEEGDRPPPRAAHGASKGPQDRDLRVRGQAARRLGGGPPRQPRARWGPDELEQ